MMMWAPTRRQISPKVLSRFLFNESLNGPDMIHARRHGPSKPCPGFGVFPRTPQTCSRNPSKVVLASVSP